MIIKKDAVMKGLKYSYRLHSDEPCEEIATDGLKVCIRLRANGILYFVDRLSLTTLTNLIKEEHENND